MGTGKRSPVDPNSQDTLPVFDQQILLVLLVQDAATLEAVHDEISADGRLTDREKDLLVRLIRVRRARPIPR